MRPGFGPPLPVAATISAGVPVALLVIAAMVHDWRGRGRVHPAYWWGFGAMMVVQVARSVFAETDGWFRVTDFLLAFGG